MTPETPIIEIPLLSPPRDPAWNIFDVLLVLIFAFASFILATSAGLGLAHFIPGLQGLDKSKKLATNPLFLVPVQTAAYALAFSFTRMFITLRAQQDFWAAVKWNFPQAGKALTYGLTGIVLAFVSQAVSHFLPIPKSLPIDEFYTQSNFAYLMFAFGLLVAPFIEELLFRGLIFPVAVRSAGMVAGSLITAFLFALMHQEQLAHAWGPLVLLFGVGLLLTAVRARSDSLAASWIVHFAYNATLFALLLFATRGFTHMEMLRQ